MNGFVYTVLDLAQAPGGPTLSQPGVATSGDGAATPADPELAEIAAIWAREAGAHFERAVAEGQIDAPPTRTITAPLLGKEAQVTVRLGLGLLEDLIRVYGAFGWSGLEAAIANLSTPEAEDDPVEQFISKTHRAVTEMVILGLDRIEQAGIAFARTRWSKAREDLSDYARLVREPRYSEDLNTRQFRDFAFAYDAVRVCADFVKKRRVYSNIEEEMDEWPVSRGKDPSSPYRPLWEYHEGHKVAALAELSAAARRVGANSPALLLALSDLDDDFGDDPADKGTLAHYVYVRAEDLKSDTQQLLEGLRAGPIAKKSLSFAVTVSGQRQLLAVGGLEEWLTEILSGSEQQILLNESLLNDLANPEVPDSPLTKPTWERFVLGVHLRDMRAVAERKREQDAKFARMWAWLTKAVALLSIIALVVTFGPAAAFAAGPAAAFILGASTAVTIVALSVTAIEAAYSLTVQRAALSQEIRDRLHRVAVNDTAALAAIGQLLSARQAIATGLMKEVIIMALTMRASQIKRLGQALDLYGSIGDMEVLFAPLPASAPVGASP